MRSKESMNKIDMKLDEMRSEESIKSRNEMRYKEFVKSSNEMSSDVSVKISYQVIMR